MVAGLWPLLEVLVRGEPGALRCSDPSTGPLLRLGLVELDQETWDDVGVASWAPSVLGVDVFQQLAVLRLVVPLQPEPGQAGAWSEVLLAGDGVSLRGARLLEWLRLGAPGARCYACDAQATGVCDRRFDVERGWALACHRHRTKPQWWKDAGGLDLHLAGVPAAEGQVARG